MHSHMWYGEETHIQECTDLQTNLKLEFEDLSKVFPRITFAQYHMRSSVTQTRARYRRGPSLMKVLKY